MSEKAKIARTSANENPWYFLAKVYGEKGCATPAGGVSVILRRPM